MKNKILYIITFILSITSVYSQQTDILRISLNQIKKDTISGSVVISSPTDSGMIYSRNLYIQDTVLLFNGDTVALKSNIISGGGAGSLLHGTASGIDTYTATIDGVTSYADGDSYLIRFTNGNTTVSTLNINSLGAIPLYKNNDGELIGGDIQDGAEMLCVYNSTLSIFQVIGTSPNTLLAYVTNAESTTITKGQPVYAFGGTGDRLTVKLASNTADSTSAQTVGLVLSTSIAAGQKGFIVIYGQLDNLDIFPTSTWADGDAVYLGATPGTLTKVKPSAPNHLVYLGYVTTASSGNAGRMYVRVQNGYEMDELHDVQISSLADNDIIQYDSITKLWQNKSLENAGIQPTITLTTDRALISDSNGKVAVSSLIDTTELGYLDNVTSNIQTQLNTKFDSTVVINLVDDSLNNYLPLSDYVVDSTRLNTTGDSLLYYQNGVLLATQAIAVNEVQVYQQSFEANGIDSTYAITVSTLPNSTQQVLVFQNGLVVENSNVSIIPVNTIQLAFLPDNLDRIVVVWYKGSAVENGIDSIFTDNTLTGNGLLPNPIKVDTTVIATLSALTDSLSGIISTVSTDNTLSGDGTVGNELKVDSSIIATKGDLVNYLLTSNYIVDSTRINSTGDTAFYYQNGVLIGSTAIAGGGGSIQLYQQVYAANGVDSTYKYTETTLPSNLSNVVVFHNGILLDEAYLTVLPPDTIKLSYLPQVDDRVVIIVFSGSGGGGGISSVLTDNKTILGSGIVGDSLRADTTNYIATKADLTLKQDVLTNPITGTGTTNYLPKFGSSSTIQSSLNIREVVDTMFVDSFLNVDNGTLYVDAVNNRVGIGIINPTSKMEVLGSLSVGNNIDGLTNKNRAFNLVSDNAVVKIHRLTNTTLPPALEFVHGIDSVDYTNSTNTSNTLFNLTMDVAPGNNTNALVVRNDAYPGANYNPTIIARFQADGKVGIGTTTPTANLDILAPISSALAWQFLIKDSDNRGLFGLSEGSSGSSKYRPNFKGFSDGLNSYGLIFTGGVNEDYDVATTGVAAVEFEAAEYINSTGSYNAVENTHLFNFSNFGSSKMFIQNNGNVGIGTTSPSYLLDVNGNVRADTYYYDVTSTLQSSSDSRLKQNITDMNNVLDKLKELELVKYEWNDNMYKKLEGRTSQSKLGGTFEGMIAQQVESLFPQYVGEDADGYKTLSYVSFVIPLLKGFQEQQSIIEQQSNKITTLESTIQQLISRIEALENK